MRADDISPIVGLAVQLFGIGYFTAWSASFYPQVLLNYQRKSTSGVSPDFLFINPLGFLALSLWSWGVYFVPSIRDQYRFRHHGHEPQVSPSDLAFSLHALIMSSITLAQVFWYRRRSAKIATGDGERARLLADNQGGSQSVLERSPEKPISSDRPSLLCKTAIAVILFVSFGSAVSVWFGKAEALDWLYLMSSIKLFISVVKYMPQIFLNYRLKSVQGFAVSAIFCDLIGSILSFLQLVISSIYIERDPSGIIANPAKLGLAAMTFVFDGTFIIQRFFIYPPGKRDDRILDEEDIPRS